MSKKKKAFLSRILVYLLLALFILFLTQCSSPQENSSVSTTTPSGDLKVHFIDVGQGDAILVEDGDEDMLIDAGENSRGSEVADYLKSEKIKDLDYVIGTHPHSDHIGGLDTILDTFDTDKVILPRVNNNTNTYDDVLESIDAKDLKITYARVGAKYQLGDASFVILAPNASSYEDLNNYSVCIKLTFGKNSFLLTGDAEELSEKEMLDNGYDLSADVLKLGHHGSAYSSCKEFLDAVHPTYGVISVGKNNRYGHPNANIIKTLHKRGIRIYRTDEQGSIVFTSDGKNITVNKSACN